MHIFCIPIRRSSHHNRTSTKRTKGTESVSAMDLGWNSDFDSSLLNCWNDNEVVDATSQVGNEKTKVVRDGNSSSECQSHRSNSQTSCDNGGEVSWDGHLTADIARLPALLQVPQPQDRALSGIGDRQLGLPPLQTFTGLSASKHAVSRSAPSCSKQSMETKLPENSESAPLRDEGSGEHLRGISAVNPPRLHPLAIQSSANCPPHGGAELQMLGPMSVDGGIQQQQHHGMFPVIGHSGIALNPTIAAGLASLQHNAAQQQDRQQPCFQQGSGALCSSAVVSHPSFPVSQIASAVAPGHPSRSLSRESTAANNNHQSPASKSVQPSPPQPQQPPPPPFYLFDAPIELRANFMQSQRKLGIPVINDCNSYHYGETVKGFHPQMTQSSNRHGTKGQHEHHSRVLPLQLIDARHGSRSGGAGRVKNEREQKRAQKITELIDDLRVSMENGGWKVEMRSKFHTLSSCADYVKHLIKTMKEKEEIVQRLRADLEVKQQEIEDEALQESRSDPESVSSSLTSSTTGTASNPSCRDEAISRKRCESDGLNPPSKSGRKPCGSPSLPMSEDQSGEEPSNQRMGAQRLSIDISASTALEKADSNRGSSSNSSGRERKRIRDEQSEMDEQSSRSVSADVAGGRAKLSSDSTGSDGQDEFMYQSHIGKRRPEEVTSLERSFELDYEEVFAKSNIPQMIAATSGKIVTWNDCFLSATGMVKDEVERMTIFSLVKPEKLSSFFEIVAAALRTEDYNSPVSKGHDSLSCFSSSPRNELPCNFHGHTVSDIVSRPWDYAAMTLPCIDFPAMKQRREAAEPVKHSDPLFVTVTLMSDEDPRNRCFHCVFTDCPGTNGALGSVTPELLSLLFTTPGRQGMQNSNGGTPKRLCTSHC